jgi:hypothetical protein
LTPEQLEKVTQIETQFRERMARHHGWNHGKRGPGAKPPAASPDSASAPEAPDADDSDEDNT